VGAAALLLLPFVLLKPNRILPGEARTLLEVLPAWQALGCQAVLALAAVTALAVARPPLRLAVALAGIVAVMLAAAACANVLTPPGNKVVRIAPGAGFWILLVCLGLMATDAITRMRPGPAVRVLSLALLFVVAGAALAHGTFDNLSIMR
jgi:osmoprotectant transport system permease protein